VSFEIWIAFTLATSALLTLPGPSVMLMVSAALAHGRRAAWVTVPGVMLGDFVAMTASLIGAGAVLAASAALFTALKLVGAAYLIWLGVRLWRAPTTGPGDEFADAPNYGSPRALFQNAFIVTALNPKTIVFFVAFMPQFIDPSMPALPQIVLLEGTFLTLAAINGAMWVMLAGGMRLRLRRPQTRRLANRIGAGFLVGAGGLTASLSRAQ